MPETSASVKKSKSVELEVALHRALESTQLGQLRSLVFPQRVSIASLGVFQRQLCAGRAGAHELTR